MTEKDKTVARGNLALRIVSDTDIMSFFTEMKSLTMEACFNTQPDHAAQREELYYRAKGIDDVLNMMQQYVAASEAVMKSYNQDDLNTHDD